MANENLKILLVRLSALGDAALTLPLFFNLRKFFPTAFIGWAIEERHSGLLSAVAGIDRVHLWKREQKNLRGAWKLSREIATENYDVAIDAQGLTKSAMLPFFANIKRRIGFRRAPLEAREFAPWFDNELVSPPNEITHIAERSRWLATPLGVPEDFRAPVKFILSDDDREKIRDQMISYGEARWLAVAMGSSWETKMLPPKYVVEITKVAAARGLRPLIIWGPGEIEKLAAWRKIFAAIPNAVIAPATENVAQLLAILASTVAFIGSDSAPLHLAYLLNKPTFSWFGPSSAPRGAPPDENASGKHRHIIAHPPNRRRHGEMLWTLTPDRLIPDFTRWLDDNHFG